MAAVESTQDIHMVHLGTMGVYGYGTAGMKIPEGYLKIFVETDDGKLKSNEILYPANQRSSYDKNSRSTYVCLLYKNDLFV